MENNHWTQAQKNYYALTSKFGLNIQQRKAGNLIKKTHGICGILSYKPSAISELISECIEKRYQKGKALNYIKENLTDKTLQIKYEIDKELLGNPIDINSFS